MKKILHGSTAAYFLPLLLVAGMLITMCCFCFSVLNGGGGDSLGN